METGQAMSSCAFNMLFTKNVPHILEKIFLSVDYESFFKKCPEVCVTWRELLTSESYQIKGKLVFHDEIANDEYKLLCAAERGNIEEVKRLLSSGLLDVNSLKDGTTPLHEAARDGHTDVVQLLLNRGADKNKESMFGSTPLHRAALNNHKHIVQLLLNSGAYRHKADESGNTPLSIAIQFGHKDVVQLLLGFLRF